MGCSCPRRNCALEFGKTRRRVWSRGSTRSTNVHTREGGPWPMPLPPLHVRARAPPSPQTPRQTCSTSPRHPSAGDAAQRRHRARRRVRSCPYWRGQAPAQRSHAGIGLLAAPIPEGAAETMHREAHANHPAYQFEHAYVRQWPMPLGRARKQISVICARPQELHGAVRERDTCSLPAFMREPGIVHVFLSRSISGKRASIGLIRAGSCEDRHPARAPKPSCWRAAWP